jgi:hypothetical protein
LNRSVGVIVFVGVTDSVIVALGVASTEVDGVLVGVTEGVIVEVGVGVGDACKIVSQVIHPSLPRTYTLKVDKF